MSANSPKKRTLVERLPGSVRKKLQSEDWSNIQIVRDGRRSEANSLKNEQTSKMKVDAQTVSAAHRS
jgi:hypothetical protein